MAGRYDITTGRASKLGSESKPGHEKKKRPEKPLHPDNRPLSATEVDASRNPGVYELISPRGFHIRFIPTSFDLNVTHDVQGPIGHVNISFSAPIDQIQGITHQIMKFIRYNI